MRRKGIVLFVLLIFSFGLLPQGSNANELDSSIVNEISSYTFIHYNGEKQEIVLNENVSLTLTGWADESKSSVKGQMDIHSDLVKRLEDVTIEVGKKLNEITITENESIYYRVDASDSFKVDEVKPQEINDQNTVVTENENGTSIEEVKTVDEYDTVIEDKGLTYYSTDENNQKIVISKEEYESLNTVIDSPPVVEPSEDAAKKTESSEKEVTQFSAQSTSVNPTITYSTHVQNIGWQTAVSNGKMSGTQGQALRLESIKISVSQIANLGVEYSTHVQDRGWLDYVSNGKESGTTGQAKRLEAIKIQLTGSAAANYDVFYRVHSQDYGWMNWVKNGELAGTVGKAKRLEAIEIMIKAKEPVVPSVTYKTHVENYGWLDNVSNGELSGTVGKGLRLEAIQIALKNIPYTGSIVYTTHVQDIGWLDNVSNGQVSGTSGKSKRLEAINIDLTGDVEKYYDIYYRVHAQDYGWLGWAMNGMNAGTEGLSKRLEAIEIKLVLKGKGESVDEDKAFKKAGPTYLTTNYNYSLSQMVNTQMAVLPQTDLHDKYLREDALVQNDKGIWVVNGSGWNVRGGPGTDYSIVGTINNGTAVSIIKNVTTPGQPTWYQISAWMNALSKDVTYYVNPNNFSKGTKEYFQFLKLSKSAGLDVTEVNNKILNGKGILQGKASSFIDAGTKFGINEVYLISHALLETGNGTSTLSKGVLVSKVDGKDVTPKVVYNMYGISAKDSCPLQCGSEYAYKMGWTSPELAIVGGAEFIASNYIKAGQDTLYKMRWNPDTPGTHQYASDIGWAVKQIDRIKNLYDSLSNYKLIFDVPKFQ